MKHNYKLIGCLFVLLWGLLGSTMTLAQTSFYSMTPIAGTFTPIATPTATSVAATADTEMSTAFPIGFTFSYAGTPYTTVQAGSDGMLLFGTGRTNSLTNNLATATATQRPGVAPLWDDLQCTSGIKYELTGTAPNRVLTVEWLNMEWNWQSNTAAISFQVKLYETSEIIDFVYRQEATAANAGGASIGIMGTAPTDYISLQNTSAAPTTSTTASTNNLSVKPATGQVYRFTPAACTAPPAAGTAVAANNPICPSVPNALSVTGITPGAGQTYQWQSSADGVTYANIAGATGSTYNASQTVPTYYQLIVTCSGQSATSTPVLVNVSNFMTCYCTSNATSNADDDIGQITFGTYANPATAPTPLTTNPAATATYTNNTALTPIDVVYNTSYPFTITQFNADIYYQCDFGVYIDWNHNGLFTDAGEFVTGVGPATAPAAGPHWTTNITVPATAMPGLTRMRVVANETGLTNACGTYTWGETEDYSVNVLCPVLTQPTALDAGVCAGSTVTLNASTTTTGGTIAWYDAPVGGTLVGSGNSFTTPVLSSNTSYYPQVNFPTCPSGPRDTVTITVTGVNVVLVPVNATCNGLDNGRFNQTTVTCGIAPFTYSLDGGVTFDTIPTDLIAGTYSVIVKDATNATSIAYTLVIGEPTAPVALAANSGLTASVLSWTAQGNETSWVIQYGPTGFALGSGTTITPATNPDTITGLTQGTTYQFYVAAGCAAGSDFAGPFTFTTDAPFQTYNNDCGPGFTDISATGTLNNLTDDGTVGITLPFPFTLQGTAYTTATISNNGGLVLVGTTLPFTNAAVSAAPVGLYPFWDDLGGNGAGTFYQTTGTAPNRKFIVQWVRSHNAVSGNTINFEIIIDEATGEFYYLYDDVDFANATYSNGASATIGVSSATDIQVSINSGTYLANNSCIHFYTAACPDPVNLVITPHELDADIAWTAGAYGETNWTIIYGPAGFNLGTEGDTTTSTTNSANIGFGILEQNTEYDVYIFSECTLDNLTSENGLMGTFTTLPFCKTPTNPTAATDIDSLEAAWNWTANTNFPDYAIESFNIQYGMTGFELGTGTMYTAAGTNNADTVVNSAFLAGGVYQYYVQAVCGGADSVSPWAGPRTFIMPLSNDDACTPETIVVDGPIYTFNNTGASVATGEAAIAPPASGAQTATGWVNQTLNGTVWFTFTAPASGNVRVNSTGINYNGQVAIYKVNSCSALGTYELLAANDDAIGGTSLAPNFTVCGLEEDETYYLLFDAFNATAGNYSLALTSINLEAGLANVTPLSQSACSGANVDLFSTITNEQPGGTWSSPIAAVNASITGSDLETAGLAYSTFDLQYRVTDGCAYDSIIGKVRIFAPSNAGQDGTITACRNEPINLLAGLGGNADLNGTWYTPLGATTPNDIVTANTQGNYNYKYIVNNTVCPNDTAIVVVNVIGTCNQLGVSEEAFAGVEVFPNPSAGIVFVTSDINFSYVVTDANGRVVTTAQNGVKAAQKTEINLSNVERGVYFIRLNNEDAQKTYRIVIN